MQIDKGSLTNTLIGFVNTFQTNVVNAMNLDFVEANVLLVNAAIQMQTIPSLVDLALTIGIASRAGV